MKKHPGIWVTLYGIETTLLLSFGLHMMDIDDRIVNGIVFFWGAMMFWFMVYYHVKWIEKKI